MKLTKTDKTMLTVLIGVIMSSCVVTGIIIRAMDEVIDESIPVRIEIVKQTPVDLDYFYGSMVDSVMNWSGNTVPQEQIEADMTLINRLCDIQGVDPGLVYAIITVESGWNHSNLMQVFPSARQAFAGPKDDMNNRIASIVTGIKILNYYSEIFSTKDSIIVAYNRGVRGMRSVRALQYDSYYRKVMRYYYEIEKK